MDFEERMTEDERDEWLDLWSEIEMREPFAHQTDIVDAMRRRADEIRDAVMARA